MIVTTDTLRLVRTAEGAMAGTPPTLLPVFHDLIAEAGLGRRGLRTRLPKDRRPTWRLSFKTKRPRS